MTYEQPQLVMIGPRKKTAMDRRRIRGSCVREEQAEKVLEAVDLSGRSLETVVPRPSMNLMIICKLDLSNNNIKMIPESLIARMLNLAVLDVHSNMLRALPNSIGCLSKLKVLNVAGNYLESLPKTIENCRSLEEINANFNQLSRLPDTIGFELTALRKLIVSSNKLVRLPSTTGHLTSLRHLDARLNCLRALPEDLENLTELQVLNVSQNFHHLRSLPYSIGLLLSLVELDVSYNGIGALPDSMGCLGKLRRLRVEGNPLVSPPQEVVQKGLEEVKLYLSEKMNNDHVSPREKRMKKEWIQKLVKCGTFNSRCRGGAHGYFGEDDGSRKSWSNSSPRSIAVFSPWRLFSPRRHSAT
ncbi:hypothetical protein SAY86_022823 [Trapa natans]|uniref:Uncharacterized protein n=1 Tax=Trapa natans TaxID=22666 RepID=A0AAN7LP07_TRANT|nr:hypothetical protein SAY86_022823 [Trapa natans]